MIGSASGATLASGITVMKTIMNQWRIREAMDPLILGECGERGKEE